MDARSSISRPPEGHRRTDRARRSLRRFVRPYRWVLGSTTALTGVAVVLDLASPWPLKVVVDNVIGGKPLPPWLSMLDGLSPSMLAAVAAFVGVMIVANCWDSSDTPITYRMSAATEQELARHPVGSVRPPPVVVVAVP